ncbi:helix-turn-helix domain-containing protein [Gillisia sp. M10.2A]|uniref:Helix-turn-helix domain-containing protein n=1 Tax=Gillisia lutea TaxID=2909668 RepID=A0ABS9EHX2_9FLAO|nr:helix-turn-helix domain-containing protein [Gillisia lutea]MCF4101041.1 helix-turn-helix domain-containing protein [Gillisia lutea]
MKNVTQLYNVDPEDFKNEILFGVEKQLEKFAKNFKPKEPEIWIGRKEASEILGVTFPTLLDWNKKGILTPYKVGNRVRYKRSEIEQVILNSNKNASE